MLHSNEELGLYIHKHTTNIFKLKVTVQAEPDIIILNYIFTFTGTSFQT